MHAKDFTSADDVLPDKFFVPLDGTGPTAGVAVDRKDFDAALTQYYSAMGWTNNGNPAHINCRNWDWNGQFNMNLTNFLIRKLLG